MDTDALAVTCYGEGGIENGSFGFLAVPIEDCRLIEVERDKAREALARITEAARAVLDRWEQPAWKDTEPTAAVIYRLRDALGREAE